MWFVLSASAFAGLQMELDPAYTFVPAAEDARPGNVGIVARIGEPPANGALLREVDCGWIDPSVPFDGDDLLRRVGPGFEWAERPAYDPATHRITWAVRKEDAVVASVALLGRDGYASLTHLLPAATWREDRVELEGLLGGPIHFEEGHGYEDFDAETDLRANGGIGLVLGDPPTLSLPGWLIVPSMIFVGAVFHRIFLRNRRSDLDLV